jgi:DNA-binding CsgD family transcriptional regulator
MTPLLWDALGSQTGSPARGLESIRHSSYLLRAVAALSTRDAERLLRFVAEAESIGGDQPFTGDVLVELGRLIEADWVTYTEVDHVRRRVLAYVPRPGEEDDEGTEIDDESWELMPEHPVCRYWRESGRLVPMRLSDVITRRELHQNRFYDVALRPWGVEHELKVRLASPLWHAKTFILSRKLGRDFTKRDRLVLELLTPHLTRLWQAARTRRLLAAALGELERAPSTDSTGVVLLGPTGGMEFASPPAQRLLRTYFAAMSGGRLPSALVSWLESGSAQPLHRRRGAQSLAVERSADTLLLCETRSEAELTAREQEVLAWVARGKTNGQVAELLWLAPSTVRKHLENVYGKLGVKTRTAAAARFLGVIDAGSEEDRAW